MDIDVIKQFIVLANHRNYSSAALELHLSQPALSRNISLLEKELNNKLIERGQPLTLTSAGMYALTRFHEIHDIWNEMSKDMQQGKATAETIRIEDRLFLVRINDLLKETLRIVTKKHPLINMEYVGPKNESVVNQIIEGSIDIGFIFDYDCFDAPLNLDLDEGKLGLLRLDTKPNKLVLAVRPDSPLARKKGLRIEDLERETFLKEVNNFAFSAHLNIERLCKRHGFVPKWSYVKSCSALEYLDQIENNVIVNTSEHSMETLLPNARLSHFAVLDIVDDDTYARDFLVYPKQNKSPALQLFLDELESLLDTRRASSS